MGHTHTDSVKLQYIIQILFTCSHYTYIDDITLQYYDGPLVSFIGDIPSQSPQKLWLCSYVLDLSAEINWYHNGTLLQEKNTPATNLYYWSPITDVNQTGVYSCVVTLPGEMEPCGSLSVSLYVIGKRDDNN